MNRVNYIRVAQGFRPYTNPRPLAGLRGLGDGIVTDANCAAGMPFDTNGNPCAGTVGDVYGGLQHGSYGVFQAAWPWIASIGFLLWVRKK